MSRGTKLSIAATVLASSLVGTAALAVPYALPAKISPLVSKEVLSPSLTQQTLLPETKIKMGTYDADGNKDGYKLLTAGELWKQLDEYERQVSSSSTAPAVKTKEYDAELGTTIEVVRVPMEASLERSLGVQRFLFDREAFEEQMELPKQSPNLRKSYFNHWGWTDRFSAYLDTGFENYADRNRRGTHADFSVGGYVLGKRVSLIDFDSTINEGEGTSSSSYLAILGDEKTLDNALVANVSFTRGASKRQVFLVAGFIPVSVRATIAGTMEVDLEASIDKDQPHTIDGKVTPSVKATGTADAAVDLWIARAGVEGSLNIITVGVPASLRVSYLPDDHSVESHLKATIDLSTLDGSISIYAKIRKPWGGWTKYEREIFSWDGFQREWTLANRTVFTTI
jgi:hypothetical protein